MATVEALKAKLAESRAQSKQLAAQVAALERGPPVDGGWPKATARMQSVALRIFAMASFDVIAPLTYLRSLRRRADGDEIRAWYSALTADQQGQLADRPAHPAACVRQWLEAERFAKEYQVVSWAKSQNKKSVAPSPGAVLRFAATVGGLPPKQASRYRWLRRAMVRWGGRKGIFANGDQLSREVFEAKAAVEPRSAARCVFQLFPRP
jgi:hypothetical protein